MTAYYNERDPYAAQWLRNLIGAGHIAPGEVDERSITDVSADELAGFTQCHFFAGIAVWSHALRRAGWPDDQPIWTGSCPCQPFSAAGKQQGFADERHLWPVWFNLIQECRPPIVVGEQVASALDWLDLVSADMEGARYAFGASDLCAAGFGGAHIRQRLYFVGLADADGQDGRTGFRDGEPTEHGGSPAPGRGGDSGMADALHAGRAERGAIAGGGPVAGRCAAGRMGDALDEPRERGTGSLSGTQTSVDGERLGEHGGLPVRFEHAGQGVGRPASHAPMLGRNLADWLFCRDGKWRPVEPGTFPLADAPASRVGRLRAYGNALDAETASQFIGAVMDRTDKAELKRAWQIIDKGKKLRNRVLSRVRMRASRTKDNT